MVAKNRMYKMMIAIKCCISELYKVICGSQFLCFRVLIAC